MEFKQAKMRGSTNCFSCCFGTPSEDPEEQRPMSTLMRSSSTWLRERAQELPEFGERCRGVVDRIRWRRRFTGEFSYDPLSYARNFDGGMEDGEGEDGEEAVRVRVRDFSARLPASPPPRRQPAVALL